MIVVNRIKDVINISCNGTEQSCLYKEERFKQLLEIAKKSEEVESLEELTNLLAKVEVLIKDNYKEKVESFHNDIYFQSSTGNYYLKTKRGVISNKALPKPLVERLEQSIEKGIDVGPLLKFWGRFLRNPKAGITSFDERVVKYINMTYVMPDKKEEYILQGFSEEIATEMATTFQVKITSEGLLQGYKVSQEVDWKYQANEKGEREKVNLYAQTFDAITGKVTGDNKVDTPAEERVFIPAIMNTSGDEFYCDGPKVSATLGHQIRIGHAHYLPDWSFVNTDDTQSCVKGLHVGGLYYINNITGEIHNVFVDPMHIGAVPNDDLGVMRVLQYFVFSSFVAVTKSIYHSSKYGELTDKQWETMKEEIIKQHGEIDEIITAETEEVKSL